MLTDYEEALVSQAYTVFEIINSEELDPEYLMLWFRRPEFDRYARFKSEGSVREIFSWNEMCNLELPIPSIERQKKIVEQYNQINNAIRIKNAINNNLEQQAQTIFKSWFVDFEPFGGKMPEDWEIGKISDLGKVVGGSTPSKYKKEYYTSNGIAWITPKDLSKKQIKFISHGEIDITDLGLKNSSASVMPQGTVLFSSRAPIGYIAVSTGDVTTNQGFKSIVPFKEIGTAFVYFYLKNNITMIENMASGTTFKEVSGSIMQSLPALIPEKNIIDRFNSICKVLFLKQEILEKNIKLLINLRDTILPKLMSGETEDVSSLNYHLVNQ